jgi:hypothetical protein
VSVCYTASLQLCPNEHSLARLSLFLNGALRVASAVLVEGVVTGEELQAAIRLVQLQQPFFRGKIVQGSPDPLTPLSTLVFEVDDALVIPRDGSRGKAWGNRGRSLVASVS